MDKPAFSCGDSKAPPLIVDTRSDGVASFLLSGRPQSLKWWTGMSARFSSGLPSDIAECPFLRSASSRVPGLGCSWNPVKTILRGPYFGIERSKGVRAERRCSRGEGLTPLHSRSPLGTRPEFTMC